MDTIYISVFLTIIAVGIIALKRVTRKNRKKMMKEIEDSQL
jgi:hypothetical protein